MRMMNNPYYKSYTTAPSRPRSVREIPVQFVESEKKEVRFGNSSESALKIQKVLRGYLVRKSVKKIAAIRAEVEEIEKRMSGEEMLELIVRDSKERLRINEMLMNLLFKLDSVRGVDSGVRDFRKAVIKRVIALQERLDSVAASDRNQSNRNDDQTVDDHRNDVDSAATESLDSVAACDRNVDQTVEDHRSDVDSAAMETLESVDSDRILSNENVDQTAEDDRNDVDPTAMEKLDSVASDRNLSYENVDQMVEDDHTDVDSTAVEKLNSVATDHNLSNENVDQTTEDNRNDVDPTAMEKLNSVASDHNLSNEDDDQTAEDDRNGVDPTAIESTEIACTDQTAEDYCNNIHPTAEMKSAEIGSKELSQTESGSVSSSSVDPQTSIKDEHDVQPNTIVDKVERNTEEERLKKREMLLEKMVEENEKMMDMMAQLFERNAMQTRLLCSLSQRVDQLERAYLCDRLRRKKKRQATTACESATIDGSDDTSSPGSKRCGKR